MNKNSSSLTGASSFWPERLQKHGHTGWADPVTYAYDQVERLELVRTLLSTYAADAETALDFGCGSGDFSKMMIGLGIRVCGYDPFVEPRIDSPAFTYARNYEAISSQGAFADVALSVTTLDHILDDGDFSDALSVIRGSLKDSGAFYLLEYALDAESDRDRYSLRNDYQAFRTLEQWDDSLRRHSFTPIQATPFSHPWINPSTGYPAFARSIPARLRRRLPSPPFPRSWLEGLLGWHASKAVARSAQPAGPCPLKCIRCSVS